MKAYINSTILIFVFILLFPAKNMAQEEMNRQKGYSSIAVNFRLTHFESTSENLFPPLTYWAYAIDPGVELSYQYHFNSKYAIGTGFTFQTVRIPAQIYRFRFNEMSIPLYINHVFNPGSKQRFFFSAGISAGKVYQLVIENDGKGDIWFKLPLYNPLYPIEDDIKGYSKNTFFTDFSFTTGISLLINRQNELSIAPFINYRVIDNWMKNYREHFYYGIKLKYQLNLITKNEN